MTSTNRHDHRTVLAPRLDNASAGFEGGRINSLAQSSRTSSNLDVSASQKPQAVCSGSSSYAGDSGRIVLASGSIASLDSAGDARTSHLQTNEGPSASKLLGLRKSMRYQPSRLGEDDTARGETATGSSSTGSGPQSASSPEPAPSASHGGAMPADRSVGTSKATVVTKRQLCSSGAVNGAGPTQDRLARSPAARRGTLDAQASRHHVCSPES